MRRDNCLELLSAANSEDIVEEAWKQQIDQRALWKGLQDGVTGGRPEVLRDWWSALTSTDRKTRQIPLWMLIDRLAEDPDRRQPFPPHNGRTAVLLLCCAAVATRPPGTRGIDDIADVIRATARDLARFDFFEQLRGGNPVGPDVLSTPWAHLVRQQLFAINWEPLYPLTAPSAWDAVCQLWGVSRVVHECRVPVAGVETNGGADSGFLCTLVLETLEDPASSGESEMESRVCHDALHASTSFVTQGFCKSIRDAWVTAMKAESRGLNKPLTGRWRLYKEWQPRPASETPQVPLPRADDRSASGAALRGWMHALRGWHPDDELIVIAQVSKRGDGIHGLGDKIAPKVEKIRGDGRLDTIVVASLEDGLAAVDTLGDSNNIRVVFIDDSGVYAVGSDHRLTRLS